MIALGLSQIDGPAIVVPMFYTVFAVWAVWAVVGCVRSAFKILASPDTGLLKRTIAAIVVPLMVYVSYLMAKDMLTLLF